MARTMRRRGFGRRRQRRPVDWVTTFQGYNLEAGPVTNPPATIQQWILYAHADIQNIGGDDWSFGLPQYDGIVERIRGHVTCWHSPATSWWSTLTGVSHIKARIEVCEVITAQSSTAFPPAISSTAYAGSSTFFQPVSGNVEFMWEHTFNFLAQSAWGSLEIDPSSYIQREEVDIRVKRKIEKNQALVLTWGQIGRNYAGDPVVFPDWITDWELRTLVSQVR